MTILSGDIKLLASKIMDDVPNGGGGPTGNIIQDGASNAVFGDVTERARAGGSVSIRQLHLAVQTDNTSAFMDPSIIVSVPPNDANVSITLAKCDTFALRTAIANTIENYLIAGPVWPGYLFEGHVIGQRSIQLFQRPGTPAPNVGYTLALVYDEGKPGERKQFVRITRVETVSRLFAGVSNVPFLADIVSCELTDALRFDFPGSPPSEAFARQSTSTLTRDTTVANAAQFYGISTLTAAASVGDNLLRVASVYTQLVPSTRTESAALDQKPAAQRRLTLAQSPRLIEVGVTPHTMRIRVGQENRGFAWVQMLKPRPAPGTIVISYMALGNWYTIYDDGAGGFEGTGVGQVIYNTGSVSMTFPSMPDAGTSIIFQWGENTAYASRAGQAGFRAPEFAWALPHQGIKPVSVSVTWRSGGATKAVTDNGTGGLTGDASGEIDYAAGKIYLRPTAMIDAGGEFVTDYEYSATVTQNFAGIVPDAGGFASLALYSLPAPKSVSVKWITVRNVSASSGTSVLVSTKETGVTGGGGGGGGDGGGGGGTVIVDPPRGHCVFLAYTNSGDQTGLAEAGDARSFKLRIVEPHLPGTYTWDAIGKNRNGTNLDIAQVLDGSASGSFAVDPPLQPPQDSYAGAGVFVVTFKATCPNSDITFRAIDQNGTPIAAVVLQVFADNSYPTDLPPPVPQPPQPAVISPNYDAVPQEGMGAGGIDDAGRYVFVALPVMTDPVYGPSYDPPAEISLPWTAAEISAGSKQLMSVKGALTTYRIWR